MFILTDTLTFAVLTYLFFSNCYFSGNIFFHFNNNNNQVQKYILVFNFLEFND